MAMVLAQKVGFLTHSKILISHLNLSIDGVFIMQTYCEVKAKQNRMGYFWVIRKTLAVEFRADLRASCCR